MVCCVSLITLKLKKNGCTGIFIHFFIAIKNMKNLLFTVFVKSTAVIYSQ